MLGKEVSYTTFIEGVDFSLNGTTKGLVAVLTDLKAFEMLIFFCSLSLIVFKLNRKQWGEEGRF